MEAFHARYAEISAQLTAELEAIMYGATPDPTLLSRRWMARTDARNYLVVGDPAVRLPLADTIEGQAIRPTLAELEAMRADKDGQASTL
jgi:hypothetical protein